MTPLSIAVSALSLSAASAPFPALDPVIMAPVGAGWELAFAPAQKRRAGSGQRGSKPRAAAKPAGRARGPSKQTNRPAVRGGAHTNINHNNNVNVNVNRGGDRYYDHHGGWDDHWDDHWHPVRTAATVAVTAAVVGSIVRTLPPSCSTVIINGISYSQCGSTWYEPRYSGSSVQYVVVNPPR